MSVSSMDISVIIPVYNVEKYLVQCLDSLCNQTFSRGVEFICVNDGSTDGSLEILRDYEKRDSRFVVIDKENEGNGRTMNRGLKEARGKYIAILESDDWAKPYMLQRLFEAAERENADVIKGNYNQFIEGRIIPRDLYPDKMCGRIFKATDYPEFLYDSMAIWTGLYKKDFLLENNITFNETPGASYQDTSFTFFVWLYAKRMYLTGDYLVNYRMDNVNSSVNSKGKVYCLCDEFERIEERLDKEVVNIRIHQIETRMKYVKYAWNLERIAEEYKSDFKRVMAKELYEADCRGYMDKSLYTDEQYAHLEELLWSYATRSLDEYDKVESKEIVTSLPAGVIAWYDFEEDSRVLVIADDCENIARYLNTRGLSVTSVTEIEDASNGEYDYVIVIKPFLRQEVLAVVIKNCRRLLNKSGILLLGVNNPLGISRLCGDSTDVSGVCESSRTKKLLLESGFKSNKRYSVYPRLEDAAQLFSEDFVPEEDIENRLIPSYYHPDSVDEYEAGLYSSFEKNGAFHQIANAYLYECTVDGGISDTMQVTVSMERGKKYATATVIGKNTVVKKALFIEGKSHIKKLLSNMDWLKQKGIKVIPMELDREGHIVMPRYQATTGAKHIQVTLESGNVEKYLELMDQFRDLIVASSESMFIEGQGEVSECGLFDLIPLNSFYNDGEYIIFDQEFSYENYPMDVVICRLIESIYSGHPKMHEIYPIENMYRRYNLLDIRGRLQRRAARDLAVIRRDAELADYRKYTRVSSAVIEENKERNRLGVSEKSRIFVDVFKGIGEKKVYLFGAGRYAKRFLDRYKDVLEIAGILDNNSAKWGLTFENNLIYSSNDVGRNGTRIIICVKAYIEILEQLKKNGFHDVCVFNPNVTYDISELMNRNGYINGNSTVGMYGTGYIAGVFDMFHIGHLNVIRRAKSHCNHLIVGVCSDEWVRNTKKTEPIMTFEERIELVRSCRYVDEAVRISPEAPTTIDAFNKYHFDVQFSGSDYENHPDWIGARNYLREHGSELVFFPYTQTTSSSKLKKAINERQG